MPSKAPVDPILERFRIAVDESYGDRVERVVLFGSRARGDAHADSDYDVAVFLRDMTDQPAEMNRLFRENETHATVFHVASTIPTDLTPCGEIRARPGAEKIWKDIKF